MSDDTELKNTFAAPPAHLSSLAALKRAGRWLSEFERNVTSQSGEDGILAKVLGLLPNLDHWCVEFGAWDGKSDSNTYDLVDRQGYNVVLIEGATDKYRQLSSSYPHKDRAIFINAYVGWSADNGLDQLLGRYSIPRNFDLLSVDVDGNDYHIWRAAKDFRPKLVLIEYNPTIANSVDFVQPADADFRQGSSAAALVRLAREKGYELIAATQLNLLFVDRAYYNLFGIPDNSLEVMRDEEPNYVFFGYDGTVFLAGKCCLEWHSGLRLSSRKVQVLPRMLRRYPPTYTFVQRCAFKSFRIFKDPGEALKRIGRYLGKRHRTDSLKNPDQL